ncbi:MAG: HEAT repeat domain-containing protein [Candidatus Thorarchaeota archaeon]
MSTSDLLLDQIRKGSFEGSSRLLFDAVKNGRAEQIAETLENIIKRSDTPDLRIRDHIAVLLDIEPVFCALESPSYDILRLVDTMQSLEDMRQAILDHSNRLLETESSKFNLGGFDLERASASRYVVLAPEVISRRAKEVETCIVLYRTVLTGTRKRSDYFLQQLLNTTYGRMILDVVHEHRVANVVGERYWKKISEALTSLGFEPEQMLREVPADEWYDTLKHHASSSSTLPESAEIEWIKMLGEAKRALDFDNPRQRMAAMETIRSLRTRYCNEKLKDIAKRSTNRVQELAVETLAKADDPAVLELFQQMLKSKNEGTKKAGARGLSMIVSRNLSEISDSPIEASILDVSGILGLVKAKGHRRNRSLSALRVLSRHRSPSVRKDVVKAIGGYGTRSAYELLQSLVTDQNDEVQLEVISRIPHLPKDVAVSIARKALSQHSPRLNRAIQELESEWIEDAIGMLNDR